MWDKKKRIVPATILITTVYVRAGVLRGKCSSTQHNLKTKNKMASTPSVCHLFFPTTSPPFLLGSEDPLLPPPSDDVHGIEKQRGHADMAPDCAKLTLSLAKTRKTRWAWKWSGTFLNSFVLLYIQHEARTLARLVKVIELRMKGDTYLKCILFWLAFMFQAQKTSCSLKKVDNWERHVRRKNHQIH